MASSSYTTKVNSLEYYFLCIIGNCLDEYFKKLTFVSSEGIVDLRGEDFAANPVWLLRKQNVSGSSLISCVCKDTYNSQSESKVWNNVVKKR